MNAYIFFRVFIPIRVLEYKMFQTTILIHLIKAYIYYVYIYIEMNCFYLYLC
jgi:hypothetical protein